MLSEQGQRQLWTSSLGRLDSGYTEIAGILNRKQELIFTPSHMWRVRTHQIKSPVHLNMIFFNKAHKSIKLLLEDKFFLNKKKIKRKLVLKTTIQIFVKKKTCTGGNQTPKQSKAMKLAGAICVCGIPSVSCLWVPAEPQAASTELVCPSCHTKHLWSDQSDSAHCSVCSIKLYPHKSPLIAAF